MIEHRRYRVPAQRKSAFEVAFTLAEAPLRASSDCAGVELLRGADDPSLYLLRVVWRDAQAFAGSAAARPFAAALRPFDDLREAAEVFTPVVVHSGSCC